MAPVGHLTPGRKRGQPASACCMAARTRLSEEGRESRPDPARKDHDHGHKAFSPPIPPVDGLPARRRTLGRLATVLAAVISGLLASTAIVPAAFAQPIPIGDDGASTSVPPPTVQVVTTGGMAGWQIALIAVGAALVAAAAAVLLDRKLAGRRGATATTA